MLREKKTKKKKKKTPKTKKKEEKRERGGTRRKKSSVPKHQWFRDHLTACNGAKSNGTIRKGNWIKVNWGEGVPKKMTVGPDQGLK